MNKRGYCIKEIVAGFYFVCALCGEKRGRDVGGEEGEN
jgi:hypothetical protein